MAVKTWSCLAIVLATLLCQIPKPCTSEQCTDVRVKDSIIDVSVALVKGVKSKDPTHVETEEACTALCCLGKPIIEQKLCNLAIFSPKKTGEHPNCYLFYCPSTEACPMKSKKGATSYWVTRDAKASGENHVLNQDQHLTGSDGNVQHLPEEDDIPQHKSQSPKKQSSQLDSNTALQENITLHLLDLIGKVEKKLDKIEENFNEAHSNHSLKKQSQVHNPAKVSATGQKFKKTTQVPPVTSPPTTIAVTVTSPAKATTSTTSQPTTTTSTTKSQPTTTNATTTLQPATTTTKSRPTTTNATTTLQPTTTTTTSQPTTTTTTTTLQPTTTTTTTSQPTTTTTTTKSQPTTTNATTTSQPTTTTTTTTSQRTTPTTRLQPTTVAAATTTTTTTTTTSKPLTSKSKIRIWALTAAATTMSHKVKKTTTSRPAATGNVIMATKSARNLTGDTSASEMNANITVTVQSISPSIALKNVDTVLNDRISVKGIKTVDFQDGFKRGLVATLLFGVLFLALVLAIFGQRAVDAFRRRDYTRFDYLINGMYIGV